MGHLVDILGGHTNGALAEQGLRVDIAMSYVDDLVAEHRWAVPDVEAAEAWVEGVLQRAEGPAVPPPGGFATSGPIDDKQELRLEWRGRAYMEALTRRAGSTDAWVASGRVFLPVDRSTGRHRIDFHRDEFERLAPLLAAQFRVSEAATTSTT